MKIALKCESILLQESLSIFLKPLIVSYKNCDFVISDVPHQSQKPVFLVGKNSALLKTPFSKEQLLSSLREFYTASFKPARVSEELEDRLDVLMEDFRKNLVDIIRQHYEN